MPKGDHGFRGAGEAQNHRTYGVCVTYPKVLMSATGGGGGGGGSGFNPERGHQQDDAAEGVDCGGDEPADTPALGAAASAAPAAEPSATTTLKASQEGRGGESPPRGVRRGGRRRKSRESGGGSADVQVYCFLATSLEDFEAACKQRNTREAIRPERSWRPRGY